ncbi:MAG: NADH dehydrogenase FAD-containing subunit, partial [Peptostreptococcaceae bacterium]|nr:NADH dehydrogenase FAD-containing subunit [Peptostreptococcaceae bacterium]
MNSSLFLIVIPLVGAFVALFAKKANRIMATLITVFMEIFSIIIYVSGKIPVSVEIGGWQAPYGINFVLTPLSVGFIILINLAAIISILIIRGEKSYQFYSTYLVLLAAANGIVLTGDIFNFYIFSELTAF